GSSRLGWILSGAGLTLLAAGTLLVWSVSWEDGCSPRCSPGQAEGWRTRANVGYAMWAAGGAATAAGVVVWGRGRKKGRHTIPPGRNCSILGWPGRYRTILAKALYSS